MNRAEPRRAEDLGPVLAVARGARGRCPACGEGRLFGRFLKVEAHCARCGTAFHHHRADDFPPYIVMFIVGHLIGYAIYVSEIRFGGLDLVTAAILWPALVLVLCLVLLQPVKGAVVALQWTLGLHGFAQAGRNGLPDGAGGEHGSVGDAVPTRPASRLGGTAS